MSLLGTVPGRARGADPEAVEARLRRLEQAAGQGESLRVENDGLRRRNEDLERQLRALAERVAGLERGTAAVDAALGAAAADDVRPLSPSGLSGGPVPPSPTLPGGAFGPAPAILPPPPSSPISTPSGRAAAGLANPLPGSRMRVEYRDGFVLEPADADALPYQLKINFHNQFRYVGFASAVRDWTDSAGVVRPVSDRNEFQWIRGWLQFSGYAFDPKFNYALYLDYNTVRSDVVNLLLYWLDYRFRPELDVYLGKTKVPVGREWIDSYSATLGPDRSMATTFFRPSISSGVWAQGRFQNGFSYITMISDGYNTAAATFRDLDDQLSFSGSFAWEPLGAFGRTYSDLAWSETPIVRVGAGGIWSPQRGVQGDIQTGENAQVRLSDGTIITQRGALTPDVILNRYNIQLYAIDAAFKYRGFVIGGEYFLRRIDNLGGTGPLSVSSLFDQGGYAQAGYFIKPRRVELYTRTSQVTGPYGSGSEYAGGLNYFIGGRPNLRFTFDVSKLNHSPADQERTNYRAGDTGVLFRAQLLSIF
jgi:hypothetical protein